MTNQTTTSPKQTIREAFEDRGTYTPWWAAASVRTAVFLVLAAAGVVVIGYGVLAHHHNDRAVNVYLAYGMALIAVGLVAGFSSVDAPFTEDHPTTTETVACPDLQRLDDGHAAVLADALNCRRRARLTKVAAQADLYRVRAAILAAVRLSAAGHNLPLDAAGPAGLDSLIRAGLELG